jgi:hypothetical protein
MQLMSRSVLFAAIGVLFAAIAVALFMVWIAPAMSDMNVCFSEGAVGSKNSGVDESCLKEKVRSLLTTFTPRELVGYVTASTTPFAVTGYCHEAAHIIGEETFHRSKTVEDAIAQCSKKCNFGCIHGVIATAVATELGEEYVSEEMVHSDPAQIEKIGARYCKNGLCHAVGHILYIGSQDIPDALASCERLNAGTTSESCYMGVFMEAAGGPEVFLKTDTVRSDTNYAYPCDSVGAPYQHACFQYLTNFQRQLFAQHEVPEPEQFSIVRTVCESVSNAKSRADCFFGIGFMFLHINTFKGIPEPDPRGPRQCDTLAELDQNACMVGLAVGSTLTEKYTTVLNYCGNRGSEARIQLCYNAVFQTMRNANLTDELIGSRCDTSNAAQSCRAHFATYNRVAHTLPNYYMEGMF